MKFFFNLGPKFAQIATATAACLGCLVSGTVLGYSSSAVPSLQENSTMNGTLTISKSEGAWIGSLLPLGALAGSLLGAPLLSIVGRRRSMLWVGAPSFAAGYVLVSAAVHIAMLYVGRFIGGFGVGLAITAAPIMVVETAEVNLRGYLGALPQVMTTLGILLSYLLGAALNWSWLGWASLITVIPYFICLLPIPESPIWLLSHRGRQEALEALTWLRGGDAQIANQELTAIEADASDAKSSSDGHAIKLLAQKPYLRAFMVVIGLMLFQQLSGVNTVIFYTVQIFQATGSNLNAHVSTILVGIVQFLATVASVSLVERAGRRPLLTGSALFMALAMAALGTFFYLQENGSGAPGWLPIASLGVYIIAFSLGYGPLTWLVGAELLPFEIITAVNPLAVALNWTCVFLITFTFDALTSVIYSYGAFWLYGSVALLAVPFSLICVPETKGRSAEEIKRIFQGQENYGYSGDGESPS